MKPAFPKACALQEKPPQWEAQALQLESSPHLLKSVNSNEDREQTKINYFKKHYTINSANIIEQNTGLDSASYSVVNNASFLLPQSL